MGDDGEGQKAITGLNGRQLDGRTLTINEAKPKEDRASSGIAATAVASDRIAAGKKLLLGGNRCPLFQTRYAD